jgi:uncharacterized protein YPO0396
MDEKELRRELTQIAGDHAKAMERLKRAEEEVVAARTNVVRIEGAHGYISGKLDQALKQKESLQKPDAPGPEPPKEEDVIVAEVVK